ncbi:MAG TPA: hypothetical protein VN026_01380 [Bacteroidia bacterium]|jgi:hypothetical protein|nr:hypothetical protein [Bacteroidia bacterium]
MGNNTENFLKNKLSIDELDLEIPNISLVNEAREKIALRKKQIPAKENFFSFIYDYFGFEIKSYQIGLATLLIACGIFYFTNNVNEKNDSTLISKNAANNYSISSSTVLASLTQYTNNKTAANSSTVLTSIITFVIRN